MLLRAAGIGSLRPETAGRTGERRSAVPADPKSEAKGKKTKTVNGRKVKVGNGATARQIPLWWDQGTLDDLRAWKREREQQGASASDYFVCAQQDGTRGKRLDRRNARNRFIVACRALGSARAAEITIHHGRHSYISHALAGGRSLAEVAAAAGHANITITAIYTHVAVDDDGRIGSLFSFNPNGKRRPTTMSGRLPAYRGELQPLCGASVVRIQPYRSKLPAARSLTRTSDRSRGIKSETTKPWASGT